MISRPVLQNKRPPPMGWFDEQFTQIKWPMLLALVVLFSPLMLLFSGLGLMMTREPLARRKAMTAFGLGCVCFILVATLLYKIRHDPTF